MSSILTIGFLVMLTLLTKSLLTDDDAPEYQKAELIRIRAESRPRTAGIDFPASKSSSMQEDPAFV